ncbi:hypothetical protein [Gimesia fumaroli]|uniref:DUF4440 domain-containing protein n=1 Tax=Gimesia fumaroli TaxID=2527976 RepID=A0A518IK07_9PLAN|nr:hypothetical protein [Gimesia fumaroli]QDV53375.1 hypothetical protein Enr17x_54500 [Gimesia fumaroli]
MWITETAVPPILICCVIATILFVQWYLRRQTKYIAGAIVMVVLMFGFYLLELNIITTREQVESDLYGLVNAFENKEVDTTMNYISPRADVLRQLVQTALNLVTIDGELRITDVETALRSEDSVATTHFRANGAATFGSFSGRHPTRWELTWQKMGGEWKVIKATRLNPITGEELRPMSLK